MKIKFTMFTLLLLIITSVLGGCLNIDINISPETTTEADTEVTTETIVETTAESTASVSETTESTIDYSLVYDDLLFETYKFILLVVYDSESVVATDGTIGILETVNGMSDTEALESIGYVTEDINSDGVPELFIVAVDENEADTCVGTRIVAAYTYSNDSTKLLFEGMARDRYYLLDDKLIYNEGSSGAAYSIFATYTMPKNATDIEVKDFYFTAPIDDSYDELGLYYNTTGEMDALVSTEFDGTADDFWQLQTDLASKIKSYELTPFEVFHAGPEDDDASYVYAEYEAAVYEGITYCEEFVADNSEHETKVVFFANGEITDFKFMSIEWADDEDGGEIDFVMKEMYTLDKLSEDKPLLVTMTFTGSMPSYGISYDDEYGNEHNCIVEISNEDGSLVLSEY